MELQLWSWLGCFGILRHIRIPSSRLKVGGRPPLELQLWSRLGYFGILQDSQLSAQGRRTASFGATTLVSARLLWNPSSRLKVGGRPPLDLQLWSRLGCFGILQDSQLSAQGRRTASFGATTLVSSRLLWNPSTYQDSQLSAQGKRTTSFGSTTLVSARLLWNPSGFPALDSR